MPSKLMDSPIGYDDILCQHCCIPTLLLRQFYIGFYAIFGGFCGLMIVIRSLTIRLGGLAASTKLHDMMLDRILSATMSFFDANPCVPCQCLIPCPHYLASAALIDRLSPWGRLKPQLLMSRCPYMFT